MMGSLRNRRLELFQRRFWHRWVAIGAIGVVTIALGCFALCHRQPLSTPFQPGHWHRDIITTEFWVGEPADGDNAGISNTASVWDDAWQQHYGGVDSPDQRHGYRPAAFTPQENPFYVALPYSDIDNQGSRKADARLCRRMNGDQPTAYSWCKNTWIAVTYHGHTAYAQWEDAGPFGENDTAYVFGTASPSNRMLTKAGLDVSPALDAYLGLSGLNQTAWRFVRENQVPNGPWKQLITTSRGEELVN
jgi:hypothetical protein